MIAHQAYCAAVAYQLDVCTCGALFRAVSRLREEAPGALPTTIKHDDEARLSAGESSRNVHADLDAVDC